MYGRVYAIMPLNGGGFLRALPGELDFMVKYC